MSHRIALRLALPLVVVLAGSSLAGCRAPRETLYAESTIRAERVHVRVNDAHVRGDRVFVKTWVHNASAEPMVVHRDELALRLSDGTVVPAKVGRTSKRPVVIAPGKSRHVRVHFDAPEGTDLSAAQLVMQGVHFGASEPKSLGEIALTKKLRTFVLSPEGAGPVVVAAPDAPEAEEPAADVPVEEDEEPEIEADEVEADGQDDDGSWQIGPG